MMWSTTVSVRAYVGYEGFSDQAMEIYVFLTDVYMYVFAAAVAGPVGFGYAHQLACA